MALVRFPSRLYAIASPTPDRDVVDVARQLLDGGARIVQLRWKEASSGELLEAASELRELTRSRAFFVVNDRVDVGLDARADAVHLGTEDLPLDAARRLASGRLRIGISTHDPAAATAAERGGADYVGFGPVFETSTKPGERTPRGLEGIRAARRRTSVPIVAIGGATPERGQSMIEAGADAVAAIHALIGAPSIPEATARFLTELGEPV